MMDFQILDFATGMLRSPARIMLALVLVLVLGVVLMARPAHADVFVVDSVADSNAVACTAAANDCTLRVAINRANTTTGTDTINFNIPGSGVKTISPDSALPTITGAVTIDGYTQGDGTADDATPNTLATGNDAHLLIELNGSSAGFSSGLKITGANVTVRGLAINRFQEYGLLVDGPGTTIEGNYIGTGVTGITDLGNFQSGVGVFDAANTIGGTMPAARNVISGNGSTLEASGISFNCNCSTGNLVQGNYIGTDKNGTAPLGNRFRGVVILDAANNTIGGTDPGAGNVISGNTLSGVFIRGTTAPGNRVQGNYIGTDKNGTAPLGNSSEGVNIDSGSGDTIGGTAPGGGNVISSNQGDGIYISGSGSQVQGNYIGTDKNGTHPTGAPDLGNSGAGVDVGSQGANNTIGGTGSGSRNVISDNNGSGVLVSGNNNQVQGNYIGTDASGTSSLGNSLDGVTVSGISNSILSNSIFANGDLGIDLGTSGVDHNDLQDPDFGANNLQNFPVIESASLNANGTVTISGTLNSTPGTTFLLQFFSSPQADPSGFGEGKTFLGEKTDVVTDSSGNASFSFTSASAFPSGQAVSATATDPGGNTSEFSDASTMIVDTIKPTVKRVVPARDATRVAPGTDVYALFSEPMRADSIKGTTFELYKKGSTTRVSADVTLDPSNSRKAILDPKTTRPNGYLERGATYKAVVSTGVKDAAGNPLARNKS